MAIADARAKPSPTSVSRELRAHNRALPQERRIRFVGTDPQLCADSVEAVAAFLRRTAPDRAGSVSALDVLARARPGSLPDPDKALLRRAEEISRLVAEHAGRSGPGNGADEALEHTRILVRAADLVTRPFAASAGEEGVYAARDRYMAEAVARLVDDEPAARVIVWEHNGHITKGTYGEGVPALGSRLRDRYGDACYALALLSGKGSFLARRGNDLLSRVSCHIGSANERGLAVTAGSEQDGRGQSPDPRSGLCRVWFGYWGW
ncbi:erythromycin esterase family protein [Streptomyces sp. NPDC127069]|uniref:erythromycin esterase family protein n=1 Tax=Streptomyces sp. NPDC127069 TaxID=3347128 RepID=UPI003661CDDA